MSDQKIKTFNIKKTKLFWLYFIPAVILLILGVLLMPIWNSIDVFWSNWSNQALILILFFIVALYIVFLIKNINKTESKTLLRFKIAEIALLAVLAVLCILNQFHIINFVGPCFVFGAIFWLRGCLNIINECLTSNAKNKLVILFISISLITFGAILMTNPISIPVFIWIISIIVLIGGLLLIILGFISKPKNLKKEIE